MEKIDYKKLLNNNMVAAQYLLYIGVFVGLMSQLASTSSKALAIFIAIVSIICVFFVIFNIVTLTREMNKNKRNVEFYNSNIDLYTCVLVNDDSVRNAYIKKSKDILCNRIKLVWNPDFVFEEETKVFNFRGSNLYIVEGYFNDITEADSIKVPYRIMFDEGVYFMNWIDNVICCDKDWDFANNFTRKSLKIKKYQKLQQ